MNITTACIRVLEQLRDSISQMSNQEFTAPVVALNGSTIGQHTRHTIEFLQCLKLGYLNGRIDYDRRDRNIFIESDSHTAMGTIDEIIQWLADGVDDTGLKIDVTYDDAGEFTQSLNTTFSRELVYNIEHAIHHMALIKVGIKEVCPEISIDASYGVAVSTLRHQRSQS